MVAAAIGRQVGEQMGMQSGPQRGFNSQTGGLQIMQIASGSDWNIELRRDKEQRRAADCCSKKRETAELVVC